MDDKRIKRHRDNVRRMKQEKRRTPEWYTKKADTLKKALGRFHVGIELDPADRSWYYDGDGTKRDKETDEVYND